MQMGMVGLGRMGANMVRRLMRGGHRCVVFDVNPKAVQQMAGEGATGAATLDEFAAKLDKPRVAWMMVPAAGASARATDDRIKATTTSDPSSRIIVQVSGFLSFTSM